jgi:hypothetical protein
MDSQKLSRTYDNIIIIAHSLGGVAMVDMLPNIFEQDPALHSKLKAIFLIGAPAQGSPLANAIGNLATILGFNVRCWSALLDLRTVGLNSYLDSINRRWNYYTKSRGKEPRLFCAYEGKAIGGFVVPVPKEHIPADCDEPVWGFDGDHNSIVKPESHNSDMYVWVKRLLNKTIEEVTTLGKTQAIDDIIALHTAGPEVDDFVRHNIEVAANKAKAQLRCRYNVVLEPSVRLALERRIEAFFRSSAESFRRLLDNNFSTIELNEIIKFERMQYSVRRAVASMPDRDRNRFKYVDREDVKRYVERSPAHQRRKYEVAQRIWALARIEEGRRHALRVVRTVPADLLGMPAKEMMDSIEAAMPLFMYNLGEAFRQSELDNVLAFLQTPVGRRYVDLAIRWISQLDYRKTPQTLTKEKQDLVDPKNYVCSKDLASAPISGKGL